VVVNFGVDTAVIDGEVVAVDSKGCPSFQALQNRATTRREWQILYYAFDLLNLRGEDWTRKPLHERKAKLRDILNGSHVRFNGDLDGEPKIQTIEKAGLEGVIAKKRDSVYRAGTRSCFSMTQAHRKRESGHGVSGSDHRRPTAPINRSHSSKLPRKPNSQAVLKLSRAFIPRRFPPLVSLAFRYWRREMKMCDASGSCSPRMISTTLPLHGSPW